MDLGMVESTGDTGGTGFLADKAVPAVLRSLEGAKAPPGEWDWLANHMVAWGRRQGWCEGSGVPGYCVPPARGWRGLWPGTTVPHVGRGEGWRVRECHYETCGQYPEKVGDGRGGTARSWDPPPNTQPGGW